MAHQRNRDKQSYCGAPECRKASKRRSAARWRAKNPDHHRGPHEVERVRVWRASHPGYKERLSGKKLLEAARNAAE